ncbi:hypothetical protein NECAME_01337, partial [Necator americanus]
MSRRSCSSDRSKTSSSRSDTGKHMNESDFEGYQTPEPKALFRDVAVSLYGLDKDMANKLTDFVVENEGYPVTEVNELKDATHAVVGHQNVIDSRKFEEFKR